MTQVQDLERQVVIEYTVPRWRAFRGRIDNSMARMLTGLDESGNFIDIPRLLLTPRQLMLEQFEARFTNDREYFRSHSIDTALAVIPSPDRSGEACLAHYSIPMVRQLIHSVSNGRFLLDGGVPIGPDEYHSLPRSEVFTIKKEQMATLKKDRHALVAVRQAIWEYITEGDSGFVKYMVKQIKEDYGGCIENRMGITLTNGLGLRLLRVGKVNLNYGISFNGTFDNGGAVIIGVVSEFCNPSTNGTSLNVSAQPGVAKQEYLLSSPQSR